MQHCTNSSTGSSQHQSTSKPSLDGEQQRVNKEGDQDGAWPVTVCLSNGKTYGADLVISAIGVEPNTGWLPEQVRRGESDGGIIVDRYACLYLLINESDTSIAIDSCVCLCSFYTSIAFQRHICLAVSMIFDFKCSQSFEVCDFLLREDCQSGQELVR